MAQSSYGNQVSLLNAFFIPFKYFCCFLSRLKDGLHRELRNNNRRVLNIYEECREHLPSNFIESKTEENCVRANNVNAFQGE